jgi:hypothetical protein
MGYSRDTTRIAWRYLLWSAAFNLGSLAALVATSRLQAARRDRPAAPLRASAPRRSWRRRARGWDIAPGESLLPSGERDLVLEASMESFPASDPPAVSPRL